MSFWKNLFVGGKVSLKRKPGGTVVGNFLRGVVSKVTDGVFGQGHMMLQPGETPEQANARIAQAGGAGVTAFNDALPNQASGADAGANFKNGVIMQKVKKFAPLALGVVGAAILGYKLLHKKKR